MAGGVELDMESVQIRLGSLVQYYSNRDEEELGLVELGELVRQLLESSEGDNERQAFIYNQVAKLYAGNGQLTEALEYAEKAVELAPDDEAYRRNYEALRAREA